MTNNISLYFHIPFCIKKCKYCAFFSLDCVSESLKEDYFEALKRQISFFETEKEVKTIYFGGGTPPILGIERIISVLELVKSKFKLDENCEITIEINPKSVNYESLCALRRAGFNRVSVGVQSVSDYVLKSLGRVHSFKDASECILDCKKAGFLNISADLIFALPFKSEATLSESVNRLVELGISHISTYSLQLEEGTPLFELRNELVFPDEEAEESQYEEICDTLKEKGFIHYEISSFAKPNFQSKHNSSYWNRSEYFGFGAGAHSFFKNKRFSAVCDIKEYIEKSFISLYAPTDFDIAPEINEKEAKEEEILLGLRTDKGAFVPKGKEAYAEEISKLGLGDFKDGVLTLNSKGFRVSNSIIGNLLT